MSLEELRRLQRVVRDIVTWIVGVFILLYEVVWAAVPNPLLIGVGLVALGLPSAIRLDGRGGGSSDDN